MTVSFIVPGVPVGKGRPIVSTISGSPRLRTPAKTERYENLVAMAGKAAMAGRPPFTGPLVLEVCAFFPIPRSWSKRKQQAARAGEIWHTSRPDLDNILKAICDGANEIVWKDDAIVVDGHTTKRYADDPHVRVTVWQLGEAE